MFAGDGRPKFTPGGQFSPMVSLMRMNMIIIKNLFGIVFLAYLSIMK